MKIVFPKYSIVYLGQMTWADAITKANKFGLTIPNALDMNLLLKLTKETSDVWNQRIDSDDSLADIHLRISGKSKRFNAVFIKEHKIPNTIAAGSDSVPIMFDAPHRIPDEEVLMIGSYPQDYNFLKTKPGYLVGMSVPPVMVAQIASNIYDQWLSKL